MSTVQAIYHPEAGRVELGNLDVKWEYRCEGCQQLIDLGDRISVEIDVTQPVTPAPRKVRADLHRKCIGMLPGLVLAVLPDPVTPEPADPDERPF